MDVSDPELTALRDRLDEVIGPDHSETLVGRLPSTTDLATRSDVDGLRTDVDGLRTDVNGLRTDVAGLRTEMSEFRSEVRVEMSGLESRLLKDQRIHVCGVLGANTAIVGMAMAFVTFG